MRSPVAAGRTDRLRRLRADRELLADPYPGLRWNFKEGDGTAVATGPIAMQMPDGSTDPVETRLEFPPGYPSRAPNVFDHVARWPIDPDRHIVDRHRFCLYLDGVDEPDLRAPVALEGFMVDVVLFLRQQLICDRIGRFPGPTWPHYQRAAYATYITERLAELLPEQRFLVWEGIRTGLPARNESCLCGSARKAKRCHLDTWGELRRLARRAGLLDLTYPELVSAVGVA
jgi:hypothetical protein